MATVGLLHPGEMGAAVGGCLVSVGHEVLWDPADRSPSVDRAGAGGRADRGDMFDRLIERSSVILSICPPHAALDVARAGGRHRVRRGSTSTPTRSRSPPPSGSPGIVTAAGATYVDGGIIGLPPEIASHTQFYPVRPARE